MKKILLLLFSVIGVSPAFADFTLNLNSGELTGPAGAPMTTGASGALILVLDLGSSGVLSPITAGSFVSGTNTVLAAASFNNFGGVTNQDSFDITAAVNVGDKIALEWLPDSTLADYTNPTQTTPTTGEPYGAANPNGAAISGGSAWLVPSSGSLITLNFLTMDTSLPGADQPNSAGFANDTVQPAAAPEPATYALLLFALPLFAWGHRRQVMVMAAALQSRF